jgi:hypothetical protein
MKLVVMAADIIFSGLFSGMVATAAMTASEIPSWRKWGLLGVFEWHENQLLSSRFFRIPRNKPNFKNIFILHILNGSLAGIAFPFILLLLGISIGSDYVHIFILSLLYGSALWIVTLVPIHKAITGYPVWNHYLGHLPSIASFLGHLIYGFVLGIVILIMLK